MGRLCNEGCVDCTLCSCLTITTWISKNAGKVDVKWELAHTKPSKNRSTALTRVSSLTIQIHHITFKIYRLHPSFTQPRQHWQIWESRPPHSFNEYQITRVNLGIKDVWPVPRNPVSRLCQDYNRSRTALWPQLWPRAHTPPGRLDTL